MEKLPFKYLGVPISNKIIVVHECMNLVQKMTTRVMCWSSRHLAYQGRLVLVNSLLLSVHVYSLQVFNIARKVLKEVECIYRAFLYTGSIIVVEQVMWLGQMCVFVSMQEA